MYYTPIKSINQLKKLGTEKYCECFVLLNGGLRSSKRILWDEEEEKFEIINEIDDSNQTLTEEELHTETKIAKAIQRNAFYQY